ncbi:hypothetical protein [Oceanobacillus massiliensis]|uniref:hypothetical protein n=1 Tax=Oceanobacillus massiliensis TaxID=1465765 RepID=UPI00301AD3F0
MRTKLIERLVKQMNNKEFWFCYDLKMGDWIINQGKYPFITKAIHPKSRSVFFLFKKSDRLDLLTGEYKLEKFYKNIV